VTFAVSPATLAEAIGHLAERPDLRPVAGCTDLMVCEPEERADMPALLDVLGIPELRGIRPRDGGLEIGAAATFTEIRRHPEVLRLAPALAEAAAVVGGWQIQNRATIGGNVANASPAGDSLPVLLALHATVVAVGPAGERSIPYADFHTGYRRTALRPGELIAWIRIPAQAEGTVQRFRKVGTREAQAISKVVVALVARLEKGRIAQYRLAAGSVAPTPIRLTAVEEAVTGRAPDLETADLAGRLAADSVEPIDDVRSTATYRRFAMGRVVRRLTLSLGESESPGA
ncbi:MAG: xanthine dehydrogenase family protein subunit M, partial [Thermoanaerobaculia bacterium]|nr:xanthine dehydrogenase family protein subunit M [Thermoanaerobaculia bacterium]